jgi:hypothetical protein
MASFGRSIGNVGKIADQPVFVTGNANKLKEVKAILAAGDSGIEITSKAVDGKSRHLKRDQDLMYSARGTGHDTRSSYCQMPSGC